MLNDALRVAGGGWRLAEMRRRRGLARVSQIERATSLAEPIGCLDRPGEPSFTGGLGHQVEGVAGAPTPASA